MSLNVQTQSFSVLVTALHAVASFVEELVGMAARWNAKRRAAAALRSLSPAVRRDLGLEAVDLDDLARSLVR
ncbi:MAG: DUF1127 domain-containing protein [Pseudomonadota bacterium]